VGSFVVQLAHRRGIRVTATVRSPSGVERAERFGADEVLVGDEAAGVATAGFDASIDAAGAGTPEWLYRAVRPGGRVVTLQEPPDAQLAESLGVETRFFVVTARAESIARLGAILTAGDVEVPVARTYPLSEGRAAYASRGTGTPGKVVLDLTS
jgi:NADPH:quinone reductase-like Zn-dependent oxidoreductase